MPHQHGMTDVPASYSEAAKLAKILHARVVNIKRVLDAVGLAPAQWDEEWRVPFEEGEVCQQVAGLMVDVQQIEHLLIERNLANENEFVPLYPRWRVDPVKHHNRNWRLFEGHVRDIIDAFLYRLQPAEYAHDFYKNLEKEKKKGLTAMKQCGKNATA